jgi:hypothetical protein
LLGNSIKIYPASDWSADDSLMVEYVQDISEFTTSDTTKTPAWDYSLHEALAYFMAYQKASIDGLKTLGVREKEWLAYLGRIRRHYAQKFRDMYPPRMIINGHYNDYL